MQADFYTSSLVNELYLVSQGNMSMTFHYFKSFTKPLQDYTFEKQNNTPRLLNPIKTSKAQLKPFLQTYNPTKNLKCGSL